MDATIERPSVEELSDAIIEKLSQAGQLAKLADANLETIEREVLENMDQITTRVISELLGRQPRRLLVPPTEKMQRLPKTSCQNLTNHVMHLFQSKQGALEEQNRLFLEQNRRVSVPAETDG